MKMSETETLYKDYYIPCECGSLTFNLRADDIGDKWRKIIGTTCAECGDKIDWICVDNIVDEDD